MLEADFSQKKHLTYRVNILKAHRVSKHYTLQTELSIYSM